MVAPRLPIHDRGWLGASEGRRWVSVLLSDWLDQNDAVRESGLSSHLEVVVGESPRAGVVPSLPDGYDYAMVALRAAADESENAHVQAGTFALWAVALDASLSNLGGRRYQSARSKSLGSTMLGLEFVRHAISHGAVPAALPAGMTLPVVLPVIVPPARWRKRADIEADWRSHRDHTREGEAFASELEDRSVAGTMGKVLVFFEDWARIERDGC